MTGQSKSKSGGKLKLSEALAKKLARQLPAPAPLSALPDWCAVLTFLKTVERHMKSMKALNGLPISSQIIFLHSFVREQPLKVWDQDMRILEIANKPIKWNHFVAVVTKHLGALLPLHDARNRFMADIQSGTVAFLVREVRGIALELHGSKWSASDQELLFRFYNGLQENVKNHVGTNAPDSWYQASEALISACLQCEQNQKSQAIKGKLSPPHTRQTSATRLPELAGSVQPSSA